MAVLTLDYRCCDRKRPLYIKHIEVERIAATARQQLVADSIDAVSFDALRQICGLKINGIDFALEVSTDYAVHDEQGNHVFGVCGAFIERILQHIDGSIYVSPRTGLFTLKLTRDDYDPATLLELNQTNVIRLESFERTLPEELVNQVTLSYHDRTTDKSVSISVQDIAGIERSLGEIKDAKVSYEGVANGALAARLAMRDLRQLSSTLAKITLVANRTAASLNIGDVFRFSWPELRIEQLILRVAQISYGTLADGRVRITCVEDVFGLPDAVYLAPAESGWVDPRQAPIAANFVSLSELPYWTIVHEMTGESAAAQAEIDPNGGFLSVSACAPQVRRSTTRC